MEDLLLEYNNICLKYKNHDAYTLSDISFRVKRGEFITILGDSGSGKTTLLKLANRLLMPSSGSILFESKDIKTIDPLHLRRKMGYVIQQVGLFPHMTIEKNIAIIANISGWNQIETSQRVDSLLKLTQLPTDAKFKKRHPWQLSGGQQQRVGIARALCADPEVLLMDEPFGALDMITRKELQKEIKAIQKQSGKTILFVTHDLQEAIELGDRVMILSLGAIQQFDSPKSLLLSPANDNVKRLFGIHGMVQKFKYLKVRDFAQSLRPIKENVQYKAQLGDSMEVILELILNGASEIAVWDSGDALGTLFADDILWKKDVI